MASTTSHHSSRCKRPRHHHETKHDIEEQPENTQERTPSTDTPTTETAPENPTRPLHLFLDLLRNPVLEIPDSQAEHAIAGIPLLYRPGPNAEALASMAGDTTQTVPCTEDEGPAFNTRSTRANAKSRTREQAPSPQGRTQSLIGETHAKRKRVEAWLDDIVNERKRSRRTPRLEYSRKGHA